jgi:hypothetical protein
MSGCQSQPPVPLSQHCVLESAGFTNVTGLEAAAQKMPADDRDQMLGHPELDVPRLPSLYEVLLVHLIHTRVATA